MKKKNQGKASAVSREAKSGCKGVFFVRKFFQLVDYINWRSPRRGYVLILVLTIIPVLLFGAKYVLDQMTANQVEIEQVKGELAVYYKRCAKEAALAVAKNWNPGLTLGQQQAAVYKVADAVYNDSPCHIKGNTSIYNAVPGLDMKGKPQVVKIGSEFSPLKITYSANEITTQSSAMLSKEIKYTTNTRYRNRAYYEKYSNGNGTTWNPHFALWRSIDMNSNPEYRHSVYDEINKLERAKSTKNYVLRHHDIYKNPSLAFIGHNCAEYNGVYYPNDSYYTRYCDGDGRHSRFVIEVLSDDTSNAYYLPDKGGITYGGTANYSNPSYTTESLKTDSSDPDKYYEIDYTTRTPAFNTDPVKISIESDQIKVETDSNLVNDSGTVAKAVPAQCNVDIVLAIPVNSAANNADNRDTASDTSGTPVNGIEATESIPSSITNTPIYQMGQACKEFVKKFYHTRGVYMSLIPYSGKLSISPDRADAWTTPITAFNSSSTATQLMIGSCLYGTRGTKNAALTQGTKNYTDTPYYWGGQLTGCPIMCRRGTQYSHTDYGSNYFYGGKLLDATTPDDSDLDYKYMRMNLNPCYVGYADTLSMKCEKQCIHYLPNPYYIIEPTADLVKIYEMCNALYPVYDPYNVSNFVFAALEWSNNMFQSWTKNPSVSTTAGTDSDAVLSRQSKTDSERKKAVILLVNKPDWFEPGEMTYLGFSNDYSEVPTAESDKIDFSIDYSNTNSTFLDGTAYNGTYKGPKQILTMEKQSGDNLTRTNGYYECGEGKYRLKFPHKGTIKLTVAPAANASSSSGSGSITFYDTNIGSTYDVRNSTSGSTISLNSAQTVSGTQTFVFSGANWSKVTSTSWNQVSSYGSNFQQNLSLYKVKYSLSDNATITNCVLKNQVIRFYSGNYSFTKSPLILSTGETVSGSNCSNIGESNIYKYKDSCMKFTAGPSYGCCCPGIGNYTMRIYGIKKAQSFVNSYCEGAVFYYLITGGIEQNLGTYSSSSMKPDIDLSQYTSYYQNDSTPSVQIREVHTSSNTYVDTEGFTLRDSLDKTFIPNITDEDLEYNRGVGLKKLTSAINTIPAGDWICFQGDGELHVTVKGGASKPELKFGYVSGDTAAHEITDETTYVITPDKITGGSDGAHYIDLDMKSLKLISAEITNRTCASIANPISATYVDDVKTASTTESKTETLTFSTGNTSSSSGLISYSTQSGSTSVVSDGRECSGTATGRLSFPYKANGTVKLTVAPSSNGGGGSGSVTFYTDNIGDTYDVRKDSTSGTSISLGTAQTVTGSQTFVFSGGSMPSVNGYSGGNSSNGQNFNHNLCVKKVKYHLSNASIVNCVLKKQITRDYVGMYGYNNSSLKPLILNDGVTCKKGSAYSPYSMYSLTSTMTVSVGDSNELKIAKFRDSCVKANASFSYGALSSYPLIYTGTSYYGPYYISFYGVTPSFVLAMQSGCPTTLNCYYYSSSGYTSILSVSGCNWSSNYTCNTSSGYSSYVKFKIYDSSTTYGYLHQIYVQNTKDKTLQSTTPITSNPITYSNLINNVGIYLANYNNENWICFQGDGELHVTVKSAAASTIQFSNTTTYTSQQTVSSQTTYEFTASQITGGSAGNYYFDFDMSNIKLVSATITCDVPTTTVSAGDSVTKTVADAIDFTNGNKTSKNVLAGTSTRILTTTISGSTSNSLYKVSSQAAATISSAVRGKLKLTVYPVTGQAAIRLRKGTSDTTGQHQNISGKTVIEVPDEYLLADTSDPTRNKCSLTINLNQVYILNATLTSWTPRYNKISSPKRSSVVDYSQSMSSKPVYNSDLVVYGQDINGNVYSTTTYDSNLGYWRSTGGYNNFFDMQLYSKNDFYFLLEDVYNTASKVETCWNIGTSGDTRTTFYRPGLTRVYSDYTKHLSHTGYGITGKEQFIHAGFTQPINTVLYEYGVGKNSDLATTDNYVSPGSDFNRTVLKQLTTDACTKLKNAGARVYVVKYRKQSNWGALTRVTDTTYKTSPTAHSYTEIDNCAANSGGFIREAANENALKEVLDEIATDIKSSEFANYKEAELK